MPVQPLLARMGSLGEPGVSERRWKAGARGTVSGIPFRVVEGRKGPDDLMLQFYVATPNGGEWRAVGMDIGFLLADFLPENEDFLYPDAARSRIAGGGDYYLSECWHARKHGWLSAKQKLVRERAGRCRRYLSAYLGDGTH